MGKFPSASAVYCFHSSCVHNVQSLLGVIFDLVGIIFFLTDRFSFLLYLLRGMGKFPSASIVYCFHSSCGHNTPSLLGVNLRLNFCFLLDCLARFIFPFCCSGFKGWKPLASYVSQHSIFKNCNAEIPCLRTLFRPLWGELFFIHLYVFLGIDNKLICLYN